MRTMNEAIQPHVGTIEVNGKRYNVAVRIAYDGLEFVGRLWFAEDDWDDAGTPDRGILTGRTKEDVIAIARGYSQHELVARCRRALSNKRRFPLLRKVTEEILAKVRYLNQLSVSMRAGLIDLEGAAQEIDYTEQQLHQLVRRLRAAAGVEAPQA
jgi:hypothetical protein